MDLNGCDAVSITGFGPVELAAGVSCRKQGAENAFRIDLTAERSLRMFRGWETNRNRIRSIDTSATKQEKVPEENQRCKEENFVN